MKQACYLVIALALAAAAAGGEVVVERWTADDKGPHPRTVQTADEAGGAVIRVDLKDLSAGATVYQGRLLVSRPPLAGRDEDGRTDVRIIPAGQAEPLKLIGPWFDSFDVTEPVRRGAGGKLELAVAAFPRWQAELTQLEVTVDRGDAVGLLTSAAAGKALDVKAVHRAGQTFITWRELDPLPDKSFTLDELREARDALEQRGWPRYRVYRLDRPINADNLGQAEPLGEVKPLSGFNWRGASLDRLIYQHQLRALNDAAFARSIASGPFDGYHQGMAAMGQVVIDRLAIEDGKPLPAGTGLYVHAPDKPGRAYYAVVPMVDGLAVPGGTGWATAEAVDERTGAGVPIFQCVEDLKVFYDYPGQRRRYVQWCSPAAGTANLPNQYVNWGVYLPPPALDKASQDRLALAIYFHDSRHLYMRPRWPHQTDMITISPHDDPPTFGYGWHESLGTLRSFAAGCVRDYTARRTDRFAEYVKTAWRIDPARLSTHGMGALGGTAALHYGLARAADVSLIVAGSYDPDPQQTPPTCKVDNYPVRKTHREALEAVWGRREWDLKTAEGKSIWADRNLVAWVAAHPEVNLPFLSLGSGSMHFTWPQENAFLKALLAAQQPFWTGFTWGGEAPRFGPMYVRRDRLYVAAAPTEADLARANWAQHDRWTQGALGYWGGGEINTGLGWDVSDLVDRPDRLEVTITGSGGRMALRNAQQFRLAPGQKFRWEQGSGRDKIGGEAAADANGLVVLDGLKRGRLIVTRPEVQP
ncbi:MAG TPA: hypothetical protein VFJ30_05835 [Phycisphaerae bacterium]|nr:hypothetical protein [Phycisphaerae bacterium]